MTLNIDADTTVVFDLDDTLYKEIEYLKSAYREIAEHLDILNWRATYALMFALYREGENVFGHLSKEFKVEKEVLLALYRNHNPLISLTLETELLLDHIKSNGANITLLTGGRSITQRNKVKALGLNVWMEDIFISEELGSEKPSENNFKSVENHFKTSSYYYIADNLKKDFITPNQRGWKTIGLIDNGLNIHTDSSNYQDQAYLPQQFIVDLGELLGSKR